MKKIMILMLAVVMVAGCSPYRHMSDEELPPDIRKQREEEWKKAYTEEEARILKDTVGSSLRYKQALSPILARAIENYKDSLEYHGDPYFRLHVKFVNKNADIYIYITETVSNFPSQDEKYLLYDNRYPIHFKYDKKEYVGQLLNPKKLSRKPYFFNKYHCVDGAYDGMVDEYKKVGEDSMVFVSRGFLDWKYNIHPLKEW